MAIIEVNHVSKEYRLGTLTNVRDSLRRGWARLRGERLPARPAFKALDDVDFKLREGEVLGVIGGNGAGKSTLLKVLASITAPSSGNVVVRGKVAPLIEVGAGLVGDLTGRENIYLNATILGMRRAEIDRKLDEIVAFSELAQFLDTPVKRYSSGMQVRLGFSIATSVDADILIVDEVLAVGDVAFQRKCFDRMEDMIKRQGKTVLLVSHNVRQVERICSRAMLLDAGRVVADDLPAAACGLFLARSDEKIQMQQRDQVKHGRRESTGEVELLEAKLLDATGAPTTTIVYRKGATVRLTYRVLEPLASPTFGVGVHTPDLLYLSTAITGLGEVQDRLEPGVHAVDFRMPEFGLLPGVYALRVGLSAGAVSRSVFYAENVLHFRVDSPDGIRSQSMREGFFELAGTWRLSPTGRENLVGEVAPHHRTQEQALPDFLESEAPLPRAAKGRDVGSVCN